MPGCDDLMMMIFRSNYIYSVQTCSFGSAPKILSYLLSNGIAIAFDVLITSHCPSSCAGQLREFSRLRELRISVNGYWFPGVFIETTEGYTVWAVFIPTQIGLPIGSLSPIVIPSLISCHFGIALPSALTQVISRSRPVSLSLHTWKHGV